MVDWRPIDLVRAAGQGGHEREEVTDNYGQECLVLNYFRCSSERVSRHPDKNPKNVNNQSLAVWTEDI